MVVFLREIERPDADLLVAAIKKAVETECGAHPAVTKSGLPIAVSCGTYVFKGRESPKDIVKAADAFMFEDKAKMKSKKKLAPRLRRRPTRSRG